MNSRDSARVRVRISVHIKKLVAQNDEDQEDEAQNDDDEN